MKVYKDSSLLTVTYSPATDIQHPALPLEFALSQNYPNPFNPTTNIEFRIANFGFVSLKIFDVLGREISTLVSEMRAPGAYTVRWDASSVSSGVYFYKLEAGDFTQTRKLVLLK